MLNVVQIPYSINNINTSIASKLKELFPDVNVYVGHNVQDTKLPCFFITPVPNSTISQNRILFDRRFIKNLKFDINYHVEYNTPNLLEIYENIADILNLEFEFINYKFIDDQGIEQSHLIRTYDRTWTNNLNGLHYKLDLKLMLYKDDEIDYSLLEVIDIDLNLKDRS